MAAVKQPDPSTRIRDLDGLPRLGERADEVLRRARMFVFAVAQGGFWVRAAMAGYTPQAHGIGLYLVSWLGGERSFEEWRSVRASRSTKDPDLPDAVAELRAFLERWQPLARSVAEGIEDADLREEVLSELSDEGRQPRTITARAIALAELLASFAVGEAYETFWRGLVAEGIEAAAARAKIVGEEARTHVENEAFVAGELEEIQLERERIADGVQRWLDERRA
jgi:hypothetical protein